MILDSHDWSVTGWIIPANGEYPKMVVEIKPSADSENALTFSRFDDLEDFAQWLSYSIPEPFDRCRIVMNEDHSLHYIVDAATSHNDYTLHFVSSEDFQDFTGDNRVDDDILAVLYGENVYRSTLKVRLTVLNRIHNAWKFREHSGRDE